MEIKSVGIRESYLIQEVSPIHETNENPERQKQSYKKREYNPGKESEKNNHPNTFYNTVIGSEIDIII